MSKGLIIIVVVAAIFGMYGCSSYNGLVDKDTNVDKYWSQVQTQYQRRADLIPNLVRTVQGVAEFEKSTLQSVIQARANATGINLNADQLTPENIQKFQAAQDQLSGSLSRLLAVAESYPQLKATQNFSELQAQLEGTENRIAVARNDFNTAATDYNKSVRSFPNNIFAGIFGFPRKGLFEASAAAQNAPTVDFGTQK
ncbi:LemA family protein [Fibrivirga algicola]|uniref:LemA family protein n=1 Tax=Fibrivirga algicola TaxID=2950420 RepID=A0ABX0QMX5_9BACT|nr:LemA family protein [Fibrivirga algicola]ARK11261.1 LemA family protein [Fibrella sp. ES10-3-2-2]NID13133.1 LemA family protein [Fibrivirga algicola]